MLTSRAPLVLSRAPEGSRLMHRLIIAAAAASVVAVAGGAQAGWSGQASGWSSGSSCGCGGYQGYGYGDSSYGEQDGYVDQDDLYSQGYSSYGYVPFDSSTYYRSDEGYRSAYDYGRSAEGYGRGNYDESGYGSYYERPRERYYPRSYSYERHYRAPAHSYRDYHYTAPHYSAPRYRSEHRGGHSSYDGERG